MAAIDLEVRTPTLGMGEKEPSDLVHLGGTGPLGLGDSESRW
jgi:hypothetical protein